MLGTPFCTLVSGLGDNLEEGAIREQQMFKLELCSIATFGVDMPCKETIGKMRND
jgi:hypothetical protein